jgi:phosphoribosyl 1,2-cyclic phosphate phosphodiesterase
MRVTVLGSGTSHGIPAVGCGCAVCASADPRDRRARCAITLRAGGRTVLIDTPPELRIQAIRSHVRRVDALLYTHSHADHIFGLDDVRRFNELQGGELPVYGRPGTLADLRKSFWYVFQETQVGGGKPRLALHAIDGSEVELPATPELPPLSIAAIPVLHGRLEVLAFRLGGFAYVTDASCIPPDSLDRLRGLHTLILGALRHEPHPTHFNFEQALTAVRDLNPGRTFFTHLSHTIAHAETEAALPPSVRLAYDGLILDIP